MVGLIADRLGQLLALDDPNLRWVLVGCALLGCVGGLLGSFALLRKRALLGDALAHAALPGVCLAYIVTGTKTSNVLLLGAGITAVAGALAVGAVTRYSRVKPDAAMALVLSVFFGAGIVLLTMLGHANSGDPSGLNHFLFGQAAALLPSDLRVMSILTGVQVVVVVVAFGALRLVSFDRAFGGVIGLPVFALDTLLSAMMVVAIVLALQAVGVVLAAAILIIPAAAARQWTDRLETMAALAALIGAFSGVLAAAVSFLQPNLPTGPLMVLSATVMFVVSLLFAPKRGVVVAMWRGLREVERVNRENVLKTIYNIEERQLVGELLVTEPRGVALEEVAAVRALPHRRLRRVCATLIARGFVRAVDGKYVLTGPGLQEACRLVRNHRLWEVYLVHQACIAPDHVHRDAEWVEHVLSADLVAQLERRLGKPLRDVHGSPIPDADAVATT